MLLFPPHVIYLPLVLQYEPQPVNVEDAASFAKRAGRKTLPFSLSLQQGLEPEE